MRLTKNEELLYRMKRKGLTMQVIADALGISKSLVSMNFSRERKHHMKQIKEFIKTYKPNGKPNA